jgi:hypothetical protein
VQPGTGTPIQALPLVRLPCWRYPSSTLCPHHAGSDHSRQAPAWTTDPSSPLRRAAPAHAASADACTSPWPRNTPLAAPPPRPARTTSTLPHCNSPRHRGWGRPNGLPRRRCRQCGDLLAQNRPRAPPRIRKPTTPAPASRHGRRQALLLRRLAPSSPSTDHRLALAPTILENPHRTTTKTTRHHPNRNQAAPQSRKALGNDPPPPRPSNTPPPTASLARCRPHRYPCLCHPRAQGNHPPHTTPPPPQHPHHPDPNHNPQSQHPTTNAKPPPARAKPTHPRNTFLHHSAASEKYLQRYAPGSRTTKPSIINIQRCSRSA